MIPCEVVTAHTEYSVWPRKYRLSNTFTGSACHVDRSGGPGGRGAAGAVRAAGVAAGTAALQVVLNTPAPSWPAAFFAAATCASTAPSDDWPIAVVEPTPMDSAAAAMMPA